MVQGFPPVRRVSQVGKDLDPFLVQILHLFTAEAPGVQSHLIKIPPVQHLLLLFLQEADIGSQPEALWLFMAPAPVLDLPDHLLHSGKDNAPVCCMALFRHLDHSPCDPSFLQLHLSKKALRLRPEPLEELPET